jgi:cysteine desulfurase
LIYLDYNATTPLDSRVFEAMVPYMNRHWGNPSSPYSFGHQARIAVEKARERVAVCLGCKPAEIVFTSCGTEADNLAVRGAANAFLRRGNHIVTTAVEHHAVLNTCKAMEAEGCRITYLPVGADGAVRIEDVKKSLCSETILITVMHANNETGVLQPIEEIAELAKKRGIEFHTDAVQTAGKIPRRLCEFGADLISISGHKFYGPKGTAALYIREGTPLDPCLQVDLMNTTFGPGPRMSLALSGSPMHWLWRPNRLKVNISDCRIFATGSKLRSVPLCQE